MAKPWEKAASAPPPQSAPAGKKPWEKAAASQPSFFQRQGQRMVSMGTPQPDNVPVPVGQAQSAASGMFANEQAKAERYKAELAAMNAASPIPFKNTGPGGPLELNQERPDLLGMRAVARGINTNIGAANAAIDTGARVGTAMSAAPDPNMQGALAGMEYYRGEGDAPERLASAVDQGGYLQQMQKLDQQGDALPSLPIPQAQTAGEVGADIVGQIGGYIFGPGKFINKPGQNIGAVAGAPRIRGAVTREAIENAGHAYAFGASTAEPGSDRNLAGLETLTNPLSYVSIEALRAAPRAFKALDNALTKPAQLTPTNAGGASQPRPQPSAAPPVAPVAQAPIPQGPPRMAQAGPAGAGQQPAAGPATLQASPVPGNPAVARDTQDIFRKLLIDSNVPRNNVDRLLGELTNDFQVFQSSGSPIASRVGLAEFVDANVRQTANRLGMNMTPDVERQIQNAIRGRGRAAHGSEGGSKQDRQPSIISQYIEDLRTTQKDWAREQIEAPNAFNKSDISVQRDAMKATAEDIGEQVYGQGLKLAREVWEGAAPAAAGEKEALTKLRDYLLRKPYLDNVPPSVKLRLAVDDVPLETQIAKDPAGTAHRIQSKLGKSAAESADPDMRGALGEARERLLKELEAAVPAYKQARTDYGDEFATMRAFDFGRPFFAESRRPVDVADMKTDYQKMTQRQKTAARMSVRDEILGVFGMNAEDAAARLEVLTRENTLNALEEIFGAPGKRVADTLRRLRQESVWLSGDKSRGIAGVDIFSGSNTVANGRIIERDAMSVRNGFQRAIAKAGDVSKFMFAIPADLALMVGSGGAYHLPMLSLGAAGGKITKGLSSPSARKLSNATEGMFSLQKQSPAAPPSRPPRVRGPRTPVAQQPLPTDVRELLNAYAAAPTKRERQRIRRALEALGEQVPAAPATTAPRRPPEQAGFVTPGALPPLVGGSGGLAYGEFGPLQDMDRDGDTDAEDRQAMRMSYGMGGLVGGGLAGAGANRLLGPRRGAPVGRFRAPDQQTFAGVNAKTADKAALARAQNMEAEGASRDAIWDETGWFKGVDGKWRFEIDDSGAKLTGNKSGPLGSVMDHPELFRAYPDLANIRTQLGGRGGAYIPSSQYNDEVIRAGLEDPRSIALHEAGGHGVQHREGFARGSSPEQEKMRMLLPIGDRLIDINIRLQQLHAGKITKKVEAEIVALEREAASLNQRRAALSGDNVGVSEYDRTAGEVDARNIQTRDAMRLRGEKPGRPWETQDVPDDQQIVRFGSGKAESRPKAAPQKPPAQSGFGGGPTKGPLRPLMSGKVISELERAKKTLPPQVRSQIAANAAKPPTLRVSAAEATGDDPSLYTLAAPFQRTRKGLPGRKPAPNAIETGVRDTMARIDASTGKPPPLDEAGEAMRLSERQRRAAKSAAQTTANKLNPYVNEAAGIPDKPLPKSVAAREQEATDLAITARKLLEKHRLTANEYEQAVAQANARKVEIADALVTGRIAPPNQKGLLPGSAGQTVPPRQMKPVSRRDAEEMADLLFNRENAEMLDAVLSGRVTPRNRDRYHAALLFAAGGTAGAAGIAAVLADIEAAAQRRRDEVAAKKPKPVYDDPGDPRFVWDWDKIKSTRNKHMEDIQIKLNELPPNASGGKFNLKPDGIWRENGPTDRAIRKWLYDNGFDPNEDFTMEHWDILTEQFQEAQQKRGSTRAAPYRGSLGEMTTP